MANHILVINAGSSSIKVALFEHGADGPRLQLNGQIEGIGTPHPKARAKSASGQLVLDEQWATGGGPTNHDEAMALIVELLLRGRSDWRPTGAGHRVVHGGVRFSAPARVDRNLVAYLESLVPLAPLHEPANLRGIAAIERAFPGVPQVACFDTAFHRGRPFHADAYALPRQLYDEGVRRYGFHGLSYEYIVRSLRAIAPDVANGRVIVAHLGNGASLCAIHAGRCIETTMGFTALDGLPMGTRCGQLDPGVLLYLLTEKKMSPDELSELVYQHSGLLGVSGISSDMRDLLASADERARQAIDLFIYRVTTQVGALTAALNGLDAIVFTGGMGEHAVSIRERVCRQFAWLGLEVDPAANAADSTRITAPASKVSAWVVPTDEEKMIAHHVIAVLGL